MTGTDLLFLAGAVIAGSGILGLALVVAARLWSPRGQTVDDGVLFVRGDLDPHERIFARQLAQAVRRYDAGGRG